MNRLPSIPRLPGLLLLGMPLLGVSSCAVLAPPAKPGVVVFFTERSADIDPSAANSIASVAADARASGKTVTVVGWTDSVGSPQADVLLSDLRARHVAEALIADGVSPARITQTGRGQTGDDPGVASRRVEIDLGS